jgi:IS4 transposase
MLVLFDRGFCSHAFFRDAAATGADVVLRVSASFTLAPTTVLPDGTYLAELKPGARRDGPPITVRVIEYSVTTQAVGNGKATCEVFCLVTNLTDPDEAPAPEVAARYAGRWTIEVLYKAVKIDLNGVRPVTAIRTRRHGPGRDLVAAGPLPDPVAPGRRGHHRPPR